MQGRLRRGVRFMPARCVIWFIIGVPATAEDAAGICCEDSEQDDAQA
jgi:hypothetical protein